MISFHYTTLGWRPSGVSISKSDPVPTQEFSLSNVRGDYLSTVQSQTPLEYIRTKAETYLTRKYPDKTYNDLLLTRTLTPEVMNILPASMQYNQVRITHEYTEIPDELKHKVQFHCQQIGGHNNHR